MRSTTAFTISLLLALAGACAGAPEAGSGAVRYDDEQPAYGLVAADPAASASPSASPSPEPSGAPAAFAADAAPSAATGERSLIYNGQIRVEVAQPADVMEAFRAQVKEWGGHLQSQIDRTLVVRVPAARFDEAFEWVRGQGRVLSEARRAQDVTEEMVDLDIRLLNARKSRERLLAILEKADKVDDILKVEAELRRLTEEIERMEARRKLLADQVALATLEATFQPSAAVPAAKGRRHASRFEWINHIGAERVMEDF